jgi:hypothetical protein
VDMLIALPAGRIIWKFNSKGATASIGDAINTAKASQAKGSFVNQQGGALSAFRLKGFRGCETQDLDGEFEQR